MKVYKKKLTVCKEDIDDLNHVNNVRFLQWIQDVSKEHWVFAAPKKMQENIMWVVSSHFIEYKLAAFLGDTLELSTYITESEGAISVRIVEIYNSKTNKLIVRSKTNWCLLSATNLRPMRISNDLKNIFID